ncbi:hypothetical protein VTI74DRAFT_2214 [Chaetomium olivicolor]
MDRTGILFVILRILSTQTAGDGKAESTAPRNDMRSNLRIQNPPATIGLPRGTRHPRERAESPAASNVAFVGGARPSISPKGNTPPPPAGFPWRTAAGLSSAVSSNQAQLAYLLRRKRPSRRFTFKDAFIWIPKVAERDCILSIRSPSTSSTLLADAPNLGHSAEQS